MMRLELVLSADYGQLALCAICDGVFWVDYNNGAGWTYCSAACKHEAKKRKQRAYRRTLVGKAAKSHRNNMRRMRKYGGTDYEKFNALEIFNRDGWRCQICKRVVPRVKGIPVKHPHPLSASLDHTVPLSQGGAHTRANTQCAHLQCNSEKRELGTDQLRLIG